MKYTADRPYSDPDKAARRLMQHAHAFEPIQEGRIYIEKLNGPFLFGDKGTPAEYMATIPAEIHKPVMDLLPEDRHDRAKVNEAVRRYQSDRRPG